MKVIEHLRVRRSNLKVCKLVKVCLASVCQGKRSGHREALFITSCGWNLKATCCQHDVRQVRSVLELLIIAVIFFLFLNLISEWLKSSVFPLPSVLQSDQSLPWFKKHQEKPRQVLQWEMLRSKGNPEIFAVSGFASLGFAS